MSRSFDAQSLVDLPSLDSASASAVGQELRTVVAAEKKLPARIGKAAERVAAAHDELKGALSQGLGPAIDNGAERAADRMEDAAWMAIEAWLAGWSKLPAHGAEVAIAKRLHEILFPDGLRFVRLPYKQEWAEAEKRVTRIDAEKLGAEFDQLGGGLFLSTLKKVHAAYGVALGVTAPKPETDSLAPAVRTMLDSFKSSVRAFVLQVAAHVDPEDPHTGTMAERLLRPLAEWESKPRSNGSQKPAPEPGPPSA